MNLPPQLASSRPWLLLAWLFLQTTHSLAQTVLVVNEIRVVSTTGIVAAKSADGKTVTLTLTNAPGAEAPIAATQGAGITLATGAASSAVVTIPAAVRCH